MNEEKLQLVMAGIVFFFLAMALLAMCFTLFFSFARTKEIERIVGLTGSAIQIQRGLWGSGPIGRLVRTNLLMAFFFWRQIPGYGQTIASRFGDVQAAVPWLLRRWVVVPMTIFWVSMIIVFIFGGALKWWTVGSLGG